jgi:hypothetical protein
MSACSPTRYDVFTLDDGAVRRGGEVKVITTQCYEALLCGLFVDESLMSVITRKAAG